MSELTRIAPLLRGLFLDHAGVAVRVCSVSQLPGPPELSIQFPGGLPADDQSLADQLLQAYKASGLVGGRLPAGVDIAVGQEKYYFQTGLNVLGERAITGRVALVTGGAQGFGAELVRGLVQAGAFVYVADLNIAGANELCAELGEFTCPLQVNVADENSVQEMFTHIATRTGGLDLVVSNAGVLRAESVLTQAADTFSFVTDVNYKAFFLITKHAGQLFARQHLLAPQWLTDIVQINSKSGLEGSNRNAAYAGSKFGSIGLVQSFALELIAYGVKVNAICPGNFFDGPLWSDPENGLFVQYLRSGKVPGATCVADVKAFYEAKVPMGRGAQGADVLRALFYLVEQVYETGQALPVTGGQVMLN